MSWSSVAAERTLHPLWWMRISGIPYIWATGSLPSSWDAGGGVVEVDDRNDAAEEYTWSPTLAPSDRWQMTKQESKPWAGLATGGVVPLSVILPGTTVRYGESNPWPALLAIAPRRSSNSKLVEDISPVATTIPLADESGFSTSGLAYGGLETIAYTGKNPGAHTLTGATRGRYWSLARHHVAQWDGGFEDAALGGVWANHPLVYEGRIAWLMCSLGFRDSGGDWQPLDTSADGGAHTRQFWRGIVRRVEAADDRGRVTIHCSPLTEILNAKIATRLPRGLLGHSPLQDHQIYVGSDNSRLSLIVDNAGVHEGGCYLESLKRSDGAGGSNIVATGYYSAADIAEFLAHTIGDILTDRPNESTVWLSIGVTDDGAVKANIAIRATSTSSDYDGVQIRFDASHRLSFWRELGLEGVGEWMPVASGPATKSWYAEVERGVPLIRLPAGSLRQFPTHAHEGPPFLAIPGWRDDALAQLRGYVRIEDEILRLHGGTGVSVADDGTVYLTPVARKQFGSGVAEELYVELTSDVDPPTIVQGIGLYDVGLGRRLRYLLETGHGDASNGTYDEGWRGCGAYCDPHLIAGEQLLTAVTDSPLESYSRRWITFEPVSIQEAIAGDCVAQMVSPTSDWDVSSETCALRLAYLGPPSEDDPATVIDHEVIDTTLGIPWDENTDRLVNTVKITGIDHDWGSGDDAELATWASGHSLGTYGHRDPLEMDVSTIIPEGVQAAVAGLAQALAGYGFDEPFVIGGLPVTRALEGWTTRIGDAIVFSHDDILNPLTAERGVINILGRVFAISRTLWNRGGGKKSATLARIWCYFLGWMGKRRGCWTSTGRVNAITGSPAVKLILDDHWNSLSGSAKDITLFPAPSRVRVYRQGSESTAVFRTVTQIVDKGPADTSEVHVDSAVALAPPCRIGFVDHDDASITTAQLKRVFFSDGSGKIVTSTGTALSFYYVG